MAEWKKFTGSDDQLKEMKEAEHGWVIRYKDGNESPIHYGSFNVVFKLLHEPDWYLICEPHPHAEMIKRWADTGQPVYKISEYDNEWQLIAEPHWHRDTKYSFNPPKEKKFIEVRDYLYEAWAGDFRKRTAHKKFSDIEDPESAKGFVRWLDDDWRKVEI